MPTSSIVRWLNESVATRSNTMSEGQGSKETSGIPVIDLCIIWYGWHMCEMV